MEGKTIFVIIAVLMVMLFSLREAYKGWRSGAVDKIVRNAREPVYAYRAETPLLYWSYIGLYLCMSVCTLAAGIYFMFFR
ncbi:TPA: DUF2542 family protein [Citrobacter koseri]|nr:DUF2542 family protein [Citrobacter koseri]